MSVLFSKACEYALQSVIYLAAQPANQPVLQRDISRALNIPPHFLGKILQILTRHDIVNSQKGKAGGFLFLGMACGLTLYAAWWRKDRSTSAKPATLKS